MASVHHHEAHTLTSLMGAPLFSLNSLISAILLVGAAAVAKPHCRPVLLVLLAELLAPQAARAAAASNGSIDCPCWWLAMANMVACTDGIEGDDPADGCLRRLCLPQS